MAKDLRNLVVIFCGALIMFCSCTEKNGSYYYDKAEKMTSAGKYTKALDYSKKAEQLFSENEYQWKEIVVLKGEIFLWQGKEQEALTEFERAFNKFPEDEEVLLNIVVTCVRCNHPELAKDFCEKGILSKKYSDITNGLFYYYLAELAFGVDKEECRELLLQAKICFMKAGNTSFDDKIEGLIKRMSK